MSESFKPSFDKKEQAPIPSVEGGVYGKARFVPENAKERIETLISDFKDYYRLLGYREELPVEISSGMDPTVRFIGSHISVFKPYLTAGEIPSPGLFIRQDCIRTRNADGLLDDTYTPSWGSYFSSMGALTPPERLNQVSNEVFNFLEKRLFISPENVLIRVSSIDSDLVKTCEQYYGKDRLEFDSKKPEYYRHRIGMEGVSGRNFNIALRNFNGEGFSDIGNIILLERAEEQLAVEVALGSSVILKQLYGLDHVQDCTPVIGLTSENESLRRKFEDAVITSMVLYREGLRPFGQQNRSRILKQYVRSLSYFRGKSGIDIAELSRIMTDFEKREFPESTAKVAEIVIEYVKGFEHELLEKKNLTNDEKKLKASLELLV